MLHTRAANIRCNRYYSNFLKVEVELNTGYVTHATCVQSCSVPIVLGTVPVLMHAGCGGCATGVRRTTGGLTAVDEN